MDYGLICVSHVLFRPHPFRFVSWTGLNLEQSNTECPMVLSSQSVKNGQFLFIVKAECKRRIQKTILNGI